MNTSTELLTHDRVTDENGLHRLLRLHHDGASVATIAAALNAEGYRTPRALRLHRATVARVISDVAYPDLWSTPDRYPGSSIPVIPRGEG
jgi:hypothetical protein